MQNDSYKDLLKEAIKDGIERYVVGAVILSDLKVLLLHRPKDDFMGDIYELPSGKVEEGESLIAALRREISEETGLNASETFSYIGHFDYRSKSNKKTRQFNFAAVPNSVTRIKLTEHDNYVWLEMGELERYSVTDSVKEILELFWKKKDP